MFRKTLAFIILFFFSLVSISGAGPDYSDSFNESLFDLYIEKASEAEDADEWRRLTEQGISLVEADWETTYNAVLSNDELESQGDLVEEKLRELSQNYFKQWLSDNFYKKLSGVDWQSLYEQIENSNESYLLETGSTYDNLSFKDSEGYEDDRDAWQREVRTKIESLANEWESNSYGEIDSVLLNIDSEFRDDFRDELSSGLTVRKMLQLQEMEKVYSDCFNRFRRYRLFDSASLDFQTEQGKADQVALKILENTQNEIDKGLDFVRNSLNSDVGFVNYQGDIIDGDTWQEQFQRELDRGLILWDEAEKSLLIERTQWERDVQQKWIEAEDSWARAYELLEEGRRNWLQSYDELLEIGQSKFAGEKEELNQLLEQARLELDSNLTERKDSLQARINAYAQILTDSVEMVHTSRESWLYWASKDGYDEGVLNDTEWDQWDMVSNIVIDIYSEQVYSASSVENYIIVPVEVGETTIYTRGGPQVIPVIEDRSIQDTNFIIGNNSFLDYFMNRYINIYDEELTCNEVLKLFYNSSDLRESAVDYYWDNAGSSLQHVTKIFNREKMVEALTSTLNALFENDINSSRQEAVYWASTMKVYQDYAVDSRIDLAKTYGVVVSGDGSVSGYLENENGNDLLDLDSDNTNWSEFILDESQIELMKAEAILNFWKQEEFVANSVLEYAKNNSSGKEKEAETLLNLQTIQGEYSAAILDYNNMVAYLETLNESFSQNSSEIDRIKDELAALQDDLESKRSDMTRELLALEINTEIYNNQMREQYQILNNLYVHENGEKSVLDKSMINYLSAYNRFNMEEKLNLWANEFNVLLQGDTTQYPPQFSLQRLNENYESITISIDSSEITLGNSSFRLRSEADFEDFGTTLFSNIDALGQDWQTDSFKNELSREYTNILSKIAIMNNGSEKNDFIEESYYQLCNMLKPLQQQMYNQLAVREEALKIVSANEYSDLFGNPTTLEEYQSILESVEQNISRDSLINRINFEIELLNDLEDYINQSGLPTDGSFDSLLYDAYSYYIAEDNAVDTTARISSDLALLESIKTILNDSSRLNELNILANSNSKVNSYLTGGSVFTSENIDLVSLLYGIDEQIIRSRARVSAFNKYKNLSPVFYEELLLESFNNFKLELTDLGLYTDMGFTNPQTIALGLTDENEAIELIDKLKNIRRNDITALPSGIKQTYNNWFYSLQNYITVTFMRDSGFGGFFDPGDFEENNRLNDYQENLAYGNLNPVEKGILYYETWSPTEQSDALLNSVAYEIALKSIEDSVDYQQAKNNFEDDLIYADQINITFLDRYNSEIESLYQNFISSAELLSGNRQAISTADYNVLAAMNVKEQGPYYPFAFDSLNVGEIDSIYSLESTLLAINGDEITDNDISLMEQQFIDSYGAMPSYFSNLLQIAREKTAWTDFVYDYKSNLKNQITTIVQSQPIYERLIVERGIYYSLRDNWKLINDQNYQSNLQNFIDQIIEAPIDPIAESISDSGFIVKFYKEIGGAHEASYLKQQLINGNKLESLGLNPQDYPELAMFIDVQKIRSDYKPIIHGTLDSYLSSQGYSETDQEKLISAISTGQWEDYFFYSSSDSLLKALSSNKGNIDSKLMGFVETIYSDLENRVVEYNDQKETHYTKLDFYNKYIEIEEAQTHFRYNLENNIQVTGREGLFLDDPSFNEIVDGENLSAAGDKLSGFLIEYYNQNLRDSENLVLAFNSLDYAFEHPDGSNIWSWSNRMEAFAVKCDDILNNDTSSLLSWSIDDTIQVEINEASFTYNNLKSREMGCLESLSYISESIMDSEILILGNRNQILANYKADIENLQILIALKEGEWKDKLDNGVNIDFSSFSNNDWANLDLSSLTYSQLESAYKTYIDIVDNAEKDLELTKQQYNIAQGIYDYASSWYLESDEELLESEQEAYDNVDPESRYIYVNQQLARSTAARDAIYDIINNRNEPNLYQNDPEYQVLYDSYQSLYRENIALMRINQILNEGIQEQQSITDEARLNWLENRAAFFHFNMDPDAFEELLTSSGMLGEIDLSTLNVQDGSNGDSFTSLNWSGNASSTNEEIIDYFYGETDEGTPRIQQEVDLLFEELNGFDDPATQIRKWEKALLFETFLDSKGLTPEDFFSNNSNVALLKDYLGTNNTPDGKFVTMYDYDPQTGQRTPRLEFYSYYEDNEDNENGDYDVGIFSEYNVVCKNASRTTDKFFEDLYSTVLSSYESSVSNENENQYQFYRFLRKAGFVNADGKDLGEHLMDYLAYNTMKAARRNIVKKHDRCVDKWQFFKADRINRYDLEDIDDKTPSGQISRDISSRINVLTDNISEFRNLYIVEKNKLDNLIGADNSNSTINDLVDQIEIAFNLKHLDLGSLMQKYGFVSENASDLEILDSLKSLLQRQNYATLQPQAENNSQLLSLIYLNSQNKVDDSEQAFDSYLYSTDSNNEGLAITQNELVDEAAVIKVEAETVLAEYYENGHLELKDNTDEIEVLSNYLSNFETSTDPIRMTTLATNLESFIQRIYSTEDSNEATILKIEELLAAFNEENLDIFMINAAEELSEYIESAQNGVDYLEIVENALLNPVFSEREHLLRMSQNQLGLIQSITSDFGVVSIEESSKIISDYKELLAGQQGLNIFSSNQIGNYGLVDLHNEGYREIRNAELAQMQLDLEERETLWTNQMNAIMSRGLQAWRDASRDLNANYNQWNKEFNEAYSKQNNNWNMKYVAFNEGKTEWLENITEQATQVGNQEILDMMGQNTSDKIADLTVIDIESVLPETLSSDELVRQVLDQETLDQLIDSAKSKNQFIGSVGNRQLYMNTGSSFLTTTEMMAIKDFQQANNDELKGHLGLLQYEKMVDQLREAQENFDESIALSNRRFSENMDNTFGRSGYDIEGNNYVRDVVVGGTLTDILREEKRVKRFNYFDDYQSNFDQSLLSEDIDPEYISFEGIQVLIAKGMDDIKEEQEKIFGSEDDETTYIDQRKGSSEVFTDIDPEDLALMQEEAEDNYNRRIIEVQPGLFNEHIGYAPVFKKDASHEDSISKNTLLAGKGEMGRMIGHFMQNNMIHQAGLAEARKPIYDRKLWDDRGQFLEAPTIRTVTDVAVSVVATVATAGMAGPAIVAIAASTAISMADDLVFALADISNGADAGQVWGGFAKKGAVSFASGAVGGAFNSGAATSFFGEGVGGSIAKAGLQGVTNNTVTGAINAYDFSSGKFDSEAFGQSIYGKDALVGYATSMTGAGVSSAISNNINTSDLASKGWDHWAADAGSLGGFAGSVASMGLEYGLTGSTTVNLAGFNYGDKGQFRQGLLAVKLGNLKDGEHRSSISGAGYNMSYSTISSAARGLYVLGSEHSIQKNAAALTTSINNTRNQETTSQVFSEDIARQNRLLRVYGGHKGRGLASELLSGKTILSLGNGPDSENARAQTVSSGRQKTIFMDNLATSGDTFGMLNDVVTLTHEAWRNGVDDGAEGQLAETRSAVAAHVKAFGQMAMNYAGYADSNQALMQDYLLFNNYGNDYVDAAYDSSADYWKLVKKENGEYGWQEDGSLDFDISALSYSDQRTFKNILEMKGIALNQEGKIDHNDMEQASDVLGRVLYPTAGLGNNLGGLIYDTPVLINQRNRQENFIEGSKAFGDISKYASTMMTHANRMNGADLENMFQSMARAQASDLLVANAVNIDTNGLIGEGTNELPYLGLRAYSNGNVGVTGWPGFRFVNDTFHYGLKRSMVDSGLRDQAWLDTNYPLRDFAKWEHRGADMNGSGDLIASVGGNLIYGYSDTYGLNGMTVSPNDPSKGYYSAHMNTSSIMDIISIFGSQGVELQNIENQYTFTGVTSGMVIGQIGTTGTSTGDHLHNEVKVLQNGVWTASSEEWNNTFRSDSIYTDHMVASSWTNNYSGYESKDLSSRRLWQNMFDDWKDESYTYSNYPAFFFDNMNIAPDGFGF